MKFDFGNRKTYKIGKIRKNAVYDKKLKAENLLKL